jgi:hypothetical protein
MRRNQPGSVNATDPEIESNLRIISAAKRIFEGAEIPLEILDRLIPPVPCRRTRYRLKAIAERGRFVHQNGGN